YSVASILRNLGIPYTFKKTLGTRSGYNKRAKIIHPTYSIHIRAAGVARYVELVGSHATGKASLLADISAGCVTPTRRKFSSIDAGYVPYGNRFVSNVSKSMKKGYLDSSWRTSVNH